MTRFQFINATLFSLLFLSSKTVYAASMTCAQLNNSIEIALEKHVSSTQYDESFVKAVLTRFSLTQAYDLGVLNPYSNDQELVAFAKKQVESYKENRGCLGFDAFHYFFADQVSKREQELISQRKDHESLSTSQNIYSNYPKKLVQRFKVITKTLDSEALAVQHFESYLKNRLTRLFNPSKAGETREIILEAALKALDKHSSFIKFESSADNSVLESYGIDGFALDLVDDENDGLIRIETKDEPLPTLLIDLLCVKKTERLSLVPLDHRSSDLRRKIADSSCDSLQVATRNDLGNKVLKSLFKESAESLLERISAKEYEGIPWIFVPSFYDDEITIKGATLRISSSKDFAALINLLQINARKKLVIDMRGNAGGYIHEANQMLSQLFNSKKPNFYLVSGGVKTDYNSNGLRQIVDDDVKIVLLTDYETVSAGELFAMSFKANNRGNIYGSPRTYGKGVAQSSVELSEKLGTLNITDSYFIDTNGFSPQRYGVTPDWVIDNTEAPEDLEEKTDNAAPAYQVQSTNKTISMKEKSSALYSNMNSCHKIHLHDLDYERDDLAIAKFIKCVWQGLLNR
ncbi:MAG: hypothetical protein EOO88_10060 [Pedobacter sp.]|nr:MAG: hypothetical protein EOO88_10060 [Pedobacter sp.]